jgi:acyl carrier protein
MQKIIACLKSVFPECDPATITSDTSLGDVPGWDSMNSVNFLLELEVAFSVSLLDETLTAEQHVSDVEELLRTKGAEV